MPDRPIPMLYWLWLSLRCPPGNKAGHILLEHFDYDPIAIYEADEDDYRAIESISRETVLALCDKTSTKEREIYYWCKQNRVGVVTMSDANYPRRLRELPDAPMLLYYRGRFPDVDHNVLIAAVGTRKISEYGQIHAYNICHDIVRCGGIVVSGMARGVDSVCHRGALDAGGITLAVLGCGIDRCYPPENRELMQEITENGCVMTEFPPHTPPEGKNFPLRNRIISGLCLGTVVIEGDEHSGSLITAKRALEQGRMLFALPGAVGEEGSYGPNTLIQQGAIAVLDGRDIMEQFELDYPDRVFIERIQYYKHPEIIQLRNKRRRAANGALPLREAPIDPEELFDPEDLRPALRVAAEPAPEPPRKAEKGRRTVPKDKPAQPAAETKKPAAAPVIIDKLQKQVYEYLLTNTEAGVDELTAATGASAAGILTAATFLEIQGVIEVCPGGRYRLL